MPRLPPLEAPAADYTGALSDPARWHAFHPRTGDIVVSTPPKSGTTWMQCILAMLIAGDPGVDTQLSMKSPWIDIKFRPAEEVFDRLGAQDHRRHMKSHTPFDGIPWWSELRYIAVYRHPIDVHFSFRRHVANMSFDILDAHFPEDPRDSFQLFLDGAEWDAAPLSLILPHYQSALARRDRGNLLMLHYRDMLRDLGSTVRRVADHIGLAASDELLSRVTEAASFASMQANADRFAPSAGQGFWKSDAGFFDSATSNKWAGILSDADLAAYDARMDAALSAEDRAWLEWGSAGPGV